MVLLVLEVLACIAKDAPHFRHLVVFLIHNFRSDHSLLEKYAHFVLFLQLKLCSLIFMLWFAELVAFLVKQSWSLCLAVIVNNLLYEFYFRRGALIVRRLCVLLDAERVYREFSTILEGEDDLDFASIMVQVVCLLSCMGFMFSHSQIEMPFV